MTHATCTTCSSSTNCTALTCDTYFLDSDANAANGCEQPCWNGSAMGPSATCFVSSYCVNAPCNDADSATKSDTCKDDGSCAGYECYTGTPGPASCVVHADCAAEFCDDGDVATYGEVCAANSSTCAGGADCGGVDVGAHATCDACDDANTCTVATCHAHSFNVDNDPNTGCMPCWDGLEGAAVCFVGSGSEVLAQDETCVSAACSDGDPSTHTDVCQDDISGLCAGTPCWDGSAGPGVCSAHADCAGAPCDDGDAATSSDECAGTDTGCAGNICYNGTPGGASCTGTCDGAGGESCQVRPFGRVPDL